MTRAAFRHAAGWLAAFVLVAGTPAAARAHETGDAAHPVMKQTVPEAPGKEVAVLTVDYAPGQASAPHRHSGSVFAYVARGEVLSQIGDGPLRRYRTGEGWYEPPGSRHMASRNASDSEPAQLVVFALTGEHEPVKSPLDP